MTALRTVVMVAVVGTTAACGVRSSTSTDPRLELLEQAFSARSTDPSAATDLLEEAGEGTVLEHTRFEVWLDILEETDAEASRWRRVLASRPPPDLAGRCVLGLGRALVNEGRGEEAAAALLEAPDGVRVEADRMIVELTDDPRREAAAQRLAVAAPRQLRNADPDLERKLLPALSPEHWIERSVSWSSAGRPDAAAAELRRLRWRGAAERRRRAELARAELAAGSPTRALRALPPATQADAEELVVRAEALRVRGWQRIPRGSASVAFSDCLAVAGRAVAMSAAGGRDREAGLRLVVECGTESGALDQAVGAWWRLEALGWNHGPRDWLGRRLGVALAQRAGAQQEVRDLASGLAVHARCLRFWSALTEPAGRDELRRLAAVRIADLYGVWARELIEPEAPVPLPLAVPIDPGNLPSSVQWLVDRGLLLEAMRQWRRIAESRGSTREEALTAAALSVRLERHSEAIGWLLDSFPGLGTAATGGEPLNAVRAYLPLRWQRELRAAANEAGVEPWLVAAVARQESLFGAHARSPRGAVGVLQLRPDTARVHARALGLGTTPDLYDPEDNLRIGARELARLIRRFGAVEPALAAYNAGESRALRWWRTWPDRRRFTEAIPIPETYNYVRRVVYLAEAYRVVYEDVWRRPP